MDNIEFTAPDGAALRGICQIDSNIWPVRFDSLREPEYVADGPRVEWAELEYCGRPVFMDHSSQKWFQHHLIPKVDDGGAVDATRIETAKAEVAWARRAQLLYDLAATFTSEIERAYWLDMADTWRKRAETLRVIFRHGGTQPSADAMQGMPAEANTKPDMSAPNLVAGEAALFARMIEGMPSPLDQMDVDHALHQLAEILPNMAAAIVRVARSEDDGK